MEVVLLVAAKLSPWSIPVSADGVIAVDPLGVAALLVFLLLVGVIGRLVV